MINQETLKEMLLDYKPLPVDESLQILPLPSIVVPRYVTKECKKNPAPTRFLIGLYSCRIKEYIYSINVLLIPRDPILAPKGVIKEITTKLMSLKNVEILQKEDDDYLKKYHRNLKIHEAKVMCSIKQLLHKSFYKKPIDIIANEYYVFGSKKDQLVVNKLKKKLRRHRLRNLHEKRVPKYIKFPKTEFGDNIKTLVNVLNIGKRQTRTQRKRVNRDIRKRKQKYKELLTKNRLNNLAKEAILIQKRILKSKQYAEKKEALSYLNRLKTYEKACKGTDLNPLDLLFNSIENNS